MTRPVCGRLLRDVDVLVDALDLAENRIERVLQRAVDGIALRGPQLVEVGVDALARLEFRLSVPAAQVLGNVLPRQYRLSDVVEQHRQTISKISAAPGAADRSAADFAADFRGEFRWSSPGRPDRASAPARPPGRASERGADARGLIPLADVIEHQQRREQQRRRIGQVLIGDVGRAAVHRLEHRRRRVPRFAPGTTPSPPTRPGAEIRHDVAVEVGQQQHVELLGVHHQVHARRVDDPLVVGDVGELARHFAAAVEEQAVAELHDVGLVDRRHARAARPRARARRRTARSASTPVSVMIFRLSTMPGTISCSRPG